MTLFLKLTYFFIFSLLFEHRVLAENNIFIKTYNGVTKNRICGFVKPEDLKTLEYACKHPNSLLTFSEDVFEWSIFQSSAKLQLQKNLCIQQRTTEIMNSKNLFDQWFRVLAKSWLGKRKAQLIVSKCEEINYNTNERLGARLNPNFTPRKIVDKKWLDICEDKNALAPLIAADGIFQYSLPAISSPDFFDILKDGRSTIINKKTGKPMTDAEILEADLSDLTFLSLDPSKTEQIKSALKEKMSVLVKERKEMILKIEAQKDQNSDVFNLDYATKDYLFEDDTVHEILEKSGQMKNSELPGGITEISTGAKCLLNHYESTLGGELAELVALSGFFGGIISKVFRSGKGLKINSHAKMLLLGSFPAGVFQGLRETIKTCSANQYLDTKITDRKKNETKASIEGDSLPKNLGYEGAYDLEDISESKIPSCKGLPKNTIVNSFKRADCITNAVLSLAPLQVSLPVLAVSLSK